MRNCILYILLLLSFRWPDEGLLITEFSNSRSVLNSDDPAPYIALAGEEFSYSAAGELIFGGKLANGLGHIQLIHSGNGLLHLYGNLSAHVDEQPPTTALSAEELWQGASHSLILMVFDGLNRRIINPELLLNNPANNTAPTLLRLVFSPADLAYGEEQVSSSVYPWHVNSDLGIDAGEYYLNIEWVDGRFTGNDVRQLYSLKLYVNGQLKYRQEIAYFQENKGALELFPGISGDITAIPVLLRPGKNVLELYLQDPKGLSGNYEFTIDGGTPQTEQGQL